MTKRERQLLSCLSACLSAPAGEAEFAALLGAFGRLVGAPVVTFGLQEIATRRILFSAKAETELPESDDSDLTWTGVPSDTGALRSLFRVVPAGDGVHRVLLGGMSEVPDDPFHRTVLAEVVPRLAALAFAARRRREDPARSLAERAIESLPLPFLLLREDGGIAFESRAAQLALGDGPPLRRVDGALHAADPHVDRELRALLAATSGDGAMAVLAVPRPPRQPLSLMLWRLPPPARQREGERAHLLVFLCDPHRRGGGVRELLIRSYGLTGSEARVALAVLDGKSVEQLAGELYISLNTAKTHLKSIFAKVGTARQSELVATILSGPVGLLR